ncbi:hypothetical protein BS50DRAFT_236388 [Corynespora cassiicola Philippines]|uniref:Uncharacterized protein n=1 Tax=Corynespora cassiicola Philippines TaxID=1448308 RepID=A0A2T2P2D4_CORCC|nr:hypothetical protein BS50DRAFT_236388 [Corynespora cassiicola Philippines]
MQARKPQAPQFNMSRATPAPAVRHPRPPSAASLRAFCLLSGLARPEVNGTRAGEQQCLIWIRVAAACSCFFACPDMGCSPLRTASHFQVASIDSAEPDHAAAPPHRPGPTASSFSPCIGVVPFGIHGFALVTGKEQLCCTSSRLGAEAHALARCVEGTASFP